MKKILAAVDFSDLATLVIDYVAIQAKAFNSEVLVLHVVPPTPAFIGNEMSPPYVPEQTEDELERIRNDLKAMVAYLSDKGIKADCDFLTGPIVETVVEKAGEFNADLIIVGAHSHGFLYRAFIGSISSGILKAASCPVMVIPEK